MTSLRNRPLPPPVEALHKAAQTGDIEGIKQALADGADVNAQARDWTTPITTAALAGQLEAVAYLTTVPGVDLDSQNQKSLNPFLHGCLTNNLELVKLMVEAGCDLERLTRMGGNGITPAAEKGHLEVVEYLATQTEINPNHTNTLGWTALIEAITLNDGGEKQQKIIELLLQAGADPHMPNEYGTSPLELARELGYTEIAEILVKYGA